jgi:hypothetical protein
MQLILRKNTKRIIRNEHQEYFPQIKILTAGNRFGPVLAAGRISDIQFDQ